MAGKDGASRRWCPNCGRGRFFDIRVNDAGPSDLRCEHCGEVGKPAYFDSEFPEQRCKNPACGIRIPREQWDPVTGFSDYREQLRKGFIRCPQCKGRHRAVNVYIQDHEDATQIYWGQFGDFAPETR